MIVLQAECLPDPDEVFAFMREARIGEGRAEVTLGQAWMAETKQNYANADVLYRRGIARGAAPLDVLKTRYKQFQRRMCKLERTRVERGGEERGGTDMTYDRVDIKALTADAASKVRGSSAQENGNDTRDALGHISTVTAARSHRTGITVQHAVSLADNAAARAVNQAVVTRPPTTVVTSNAALPVFTDEEFLPSSPPRSSLPSTLTTSRLPSAVYAVPVADELRPVAGTGTWKKLEPVSVRHKENTLAPDVWTKGGLTQHEGTLAVGHGGATNTRAAAPAGTVAASSIVVFEDDFLTEPPSSSTLQFVTHKPLSHVDEGRSAQLQATAQAMLHPVQRHAVAPAPAPVISVPASEPVPASKPAPVPAPGSPVTAVAEGLSYEEQRAEAWWNTHGAIVKEVDDCRDGTSMEISACLDSTAQTGDIVKLMRGLSEQAVNNERSPPPRALFKSVPRNGRASIGFGGSPCTGTPQEDVTLHTKLALDEMAELFTSPSLARALKHGQPQKSSRPVPPDARRLSMHIAGRIPVASKKASGFEIFCDDDA
jgi:hypothetical protein